MKKLLMLLLVIALVAISGCKTDVSNGSTDTTYQDIIASDHLILSDALAMLENYNNDDNKLSILYAQLNKANECSGTYLQKSESTGNVYKAIFNYYLVKGELFANIEYDGYSGNINDGKVTFDDDYLIINAVGDFYSSKHDFVIRLTKDSANIKWADLCEYDLVRGNGSVEEIINVDKPFEQTDYYETIKEMMDSLYGNNGNDYAIYYNQASRELYLYVEMGENSRYALVNGGDDIKDAWDDLVESSLDICKKINTSIKLYGGNHANICYVELLNANNDYDNDDMVLWLRDDNVKYNCTDEKQIVNNKSADNQTNSNYSNHTNSSTNSKNNTSTFGEKNALASACEYLEVSAFSREGLIEQLEYEGYTLSEATYGVDNCGADWYYQAYRMATEYLEFMSFSKKELIEQLEYEGFTSQQAEYGVNEAYN